MEVEAPNATHQQKVAVRKAEDDIHIPKANVIYAILSLLKELDEEGLRIVNHEIAKVLGPSY